MGKGGDKKMEGDGIELYGLDEEVVNDTGVLEVSVATAAAAAV
jgi:hypothetical protein